MFPSIRLILLFGFLSLALSDTDDCECDPSLTLNQRFQCLMDCQKKVICSNFPDNPVCLTRILQSTASGLPSPLYVSYIDDLHSPSSIAAGLAVPGYAASTSYNVIIYAFWLTTGPADAASIWADPLRFFSADNPWGTTKDQIQKKLISAYHSKGIKVLVSAFGATEFPTTAGKDAVKTCSDLANFVKSNNLDGVDLDWEDNSAMASGQGEDWLIACTKTIRQILPVGSYILSHAPQAPYFMGTSSKYPNGGYLKIDQEVGSLIDFYNIQYYNQADSSYDTYQSLFVKSNGWSSTTAIQELIAKGIPANKLVIGKPASTAGVVNTGFVNAKDLKNFITSAKEAGINWNAGVMTWQYSDDKTGGFINVVSQAFTTPTPNPTPTPTW